MRNLFLSIIFSIAGISLMHAQTPDPNFYIYLCFGQSNMEGNGQIEQIDRSGVNPRFQMMAAVDYNSPKREKFHWYTATPPLVRESTGLCPADWFGRTMVDNLPEQVRIGVIVVAVGGASIKHLDKDYDTSTLSSEADWFRSFMNAYDKKPYDRLLACAKEAQKYGIIKGMLLHQGETDNGQSTWPQKVKKVYTDLLTDLELDANDVPLLVGETVRSEMGGACGLHNQTAIPNVPKVIPTAHIISSEGLEHKGDGLHFTSHAYRVLGTRYAVKALNLLGIDNPVVNYTEAMTQPIKPEPVEGDYVFDFKDFDPQMYGEGKFKASSKIFIPSQWGCGGWTFDPPLDLSGYRFLIAELKNPQTINAQLRVWDTDNYFDKSYECDFYDGTIIVAEINGMMKNTDNGIQPINSSAITRVGVWSSGSADLSKKITFKHIFATNNDPYAILPIIQTEQQSDNAVYNLQGIKVSADQAGLSSLPSGIYITNGRKIIK